MSTSTTTSATISGLLFDTGYRVQVRAENATGEGPWSASGSASTGRSTATNSAPIRMQLGTSNNCVQKTATTSFGTITVPFSTQVSSGPVLSAAECAGSNRKAPMFSDPDGHTLTVTARVRNLPDNVRLGNDTPGVILGTPDSVFFHARAAYRQTDVTVDVTATDPLAAAVSTFFVARLSTYPNSNGAPRFEANPGPQRFAHNQAIQPLVLPAATGGDVGSVTALGDYRFPYLYAVDGLPDGLTFDAATRTVSGTPTELGTYRVTYTAEDADGTASAGLNPTTVDSSDTAKLTFTIQVGNQPGIERVRIVSKPQLDSDGARTVAARTSSRSGRCATPSRRCPTRPAPGRGCSRGPQARAPGRQDV